MGQRVELHEQLQKLMSSVVGESNTHVYFQPPEGYRMSYPCIVYELDRIVTHHADDKPYTHHKRYSLTVIDRNPDSQLPERIADLPQCVHDRHFINDNLHHDVFTIYF